MKVLIVTPGYLPVPAVKGGAVENLIEQLIVYNEVNCKHDIDIISIYDYKALNLTSKFKKSNFYFIELNKIDKIKKYYSFISNKYFNKYLGNPYLIKSVSEVKENYYDIILVENFPQYILKLKPIFKKGKFILHLHNDFITYRDKNLMKSLNEYDSIFCISNYLKNILVNNKIKCELKTVYNGIKMKELSNNLNNIRSKYGISEKDIVFMYSGRIVPEKGVKELLIAFKQIENKYENIRLIIVGGSSYSNNNESKYIRELKNISRNSKKIMFTGYVNYSDINKIYNFIDVGVIPSICNDAFNLTTVEFMANSKPLIISNCGAMKEIADKNCSIIVEKNENYINNLSKAIIKLYIDKEKRIEMGINAKKRAEFFKNEIYCENIFDEMEKIYEN